MSPMSPQPDSLKEGPTIQMLGPICVRVQKIPAHFAVGPMNAFYGINKGKAGCALMWVGLAQDGKISYPPPQAACSGG